MVWCMIGSNISRRRDPSFLLMVTRNVTDLLTRVRLRMRLASLGLKFSCDIEGVVKRMDAIISS